MREASEWLARLQADDACDADWASFESWRDAHPRRGAAFRQLSDTWLRLIAASRESSRGGTQLMMRRH